MPENWCCLLIEGSLGLLVGGLGSFPCDPCHMAAWASSKHGSWVLWSVPSLSVQVLIKPPLASFWLTSHWTKIVKWPCSETVYWEATQRHKYWEVWFTGGHQSNSNNNILLPSLRIYFATTAQNIVHDLAPIWSFMPHHNFLDKLLEYWVIIGLRVLPIGKT